MKLVWAFYHFLRYQEFHFDLWLGVDIIQILLLLFLLSYILYLHIILFLFPYKLDSSKSLSIAPNWAVLIKCFLFSSQIRSRHEKLGAPISTR